MMPLWGWVALVNCCALLWLFTGLLGDLQVTERRNTWVNLALRVLVVLACVSLGLLIALVVEVPPRVHVWRQRRKRRAS